MHRGNIQRLAKGIENEINFREKLTGKKEPVKEETEQTQDEIVVEEKTADERTENEQK